MSNFQDFLMESFEDVEVIERTLKIGGKDRLLKFKPMSAARGDELRKKCRKTSIVKGQKIIETDQDRYVANLIIETTVHPDFKNAELQKSWGVIGAEELLKAMKIKMIDGEYSVLSDAVAEVNGYDLNMQELIEEAKN